MPFVDVKISKKIMPEEEILLKTELGKAISVFPGKSESWLMCNIADEQHIWFKGQNDAPAAFVEVKLFGGVDAGSADQFTARISDLLEGKFGIPSSRIYVRYTGGNLWGWAGSNF